MKNKFLLLSLGITLSHFAFSQCNNSGIGTLLPNAKLEVRGCGTDSTTAAFKVTNSTDTTTTPILFLRNDKRVGIGTKYPTEKLSVIGNATFSGSVTAGSIKGAGNAPASFDSLKVTGLSGTGNRIIYVDPSGNLRKGDPLPLYTCGHSWCGNGNGVSQGNFTVGDFLGTLDANALIMKTDANGSGGERMRISATGNVGIGTIDPKHHLHLHTTYPNPSDPIYLRQLDTTLHFDTSGVYTAQPIQGGQAAQTFQLTNATVTDGAANGMLFGISGTSGFWDMQEANGTMRILSQAGLSLQTGHGNVFIGVSGSTGNGNVQFRTRSTFVFGTTTGTKMLISSIGNVGIGTTVPKNKLDVKGSEVIGATYSGTNIAPTNGLLVEGHVGIGITNPAYELDVNGTIRANEVKVCIGTCDFVFDNNYYLMPLDTLNAYLKQNHHLPGIASAKQMEEEGNVALGKLNSQLLQKVEELSLYIIQQQKAIDEMNKQIAAIKGK